MKLSTRARYAIRAMVAVARLSPADQPISLERVARGTRVSKGYLEQLAISLKRAGLVRGVAGRNGGYLLARPAEEMLIGEIVEAAIGPINIVDCVQEPEICMKSDCCECRNLYSLVNNRIRDTFNSLTLADMAEHSLMEAKTGS